MFTGSPWNLLLSLELNGLSQSHWPLFLPWLLRRKILDLVPLFLLLMSSHITWLDGYLQSITSQRAGKFSIIFCGKLLTFSTVWAGT
jgi:hypothetical protein